MTVQVSGYLGALEIFQPLDYIWSFHLTTIGAALVSPRVPERGNKGAQVVIASALTSTLLVATNNHFFASATGTDPNTTLMDLQEIRST
jgi:hypothetical protein